MTPSIVDGIRYGRDLICPLNASLVGENEFTIQKTGSPFQSSAYRRQRDTPSYDRDSASPRPYWIFHSKYYSVDVYGECIDYGEYYPHYNRSFD